MDHSKIAASRALAEHTTEHVRTRQPKTYTPESATRDTVSR